jgi:hypothetical protein
MYIIIDSIDAVAQGIIIGYGIILNTTFYCADFMSECLAILDKLLESVLRINVLTITREGKLIKHR